MAIKYKPIGIVHSPFGALEGTPIEPARATGIRGTAEVFPVYQDGLKDLEGFSQIILLSHFHRSTDFKLQVVRFLDSELGGVRPERPSVRTLLACRWSSSIT